MKQSLAQKVNKIEVNITTHYVIYGVSYDFNPKSYNITLFSVLNLFFLILDTNFFLN